MTALAGAAGFPLWLLGWTGWRRAFGDADDLDFRLGWGRWGGFLFGFLPGRDKTRFRLCSSCISLDILGLLRLG